MESYWIKCHFIPIQMNWLKYGEMMAYNKDRQPAEKICGIAKIAGSSMRAGGSDGNCIRIAERHSDTGNGIDQAEL